MERTEISATLKPPSDPAEITLEGYQKLLAAARSERATLLRGARYRARAHSKKIRLAAIDRGHREGLEKGAEACTSAINAIRANYCAALSGAKGDVVDAAERIVAYIVESWMEQNPHTIDLWISYAINYLGGSRPIVVKYHPRYRHTIGSCKHSCDPLIRLEMDSSLSEIDLYLETSTGGVTFSWRELLRRLVEPSALSSNSAAMKR